MMIMAILASAFLAICLVTATCLPALIAIPIAGSSFDEQILIRLGELAFAVGRGLLYGVTTSLFFCFLVLALGDSYALAISLQLNGIFFGIASGVALALSYAIAFQMSSPSISCWIIGLTYGLIGRTDGFKSDRAIPIFLIGTWNFLLISGALYGSLPDGNGFTIIMSTSVILGYLGFPIYTVETWISMLYPLHDERHPIWWDENFAYFPLLGLDINSQTPKFWASGEEVGLLRLARLSSNPFVYWYVNRALVHQLKHSPSPLRFLYSFLRLDELHVYAVPPLSIQDWRFLQPIQHVFLAELAGNPSADNAGPYESAVLRFTRPFRSQIETPFCELAKVLCFISQLGATGVWGSENLLLQLEQFQKESGSILNYPGGSDLHNSFAYITHSLRASSLSDLSEFHVLLREHPTAQDAICPEVIEILQRLGQISQNIAVAQAASSRLNRLAAFARSTEGLEDLGPLIMETVVVPEKVLLLAIRDHWRSLVAEAGGLLGQQVQHQRVVNPYVAGNPVKGGLFVGRDEILGQLEEIWLKPGPVDSVVLYGHRRMGKSSILQNLPLRLDPASNWVVEFNLQTVNRSHTGSLLFDLASKMRDAVLLDSTVGIAASASVELIVPEEEAFRANYQRAFNQWLDRLTAWIAGRRIIIAIDEYELMEEAMADARLDAELTTYLRGVIQTRDWFVLALAGLYTVHEQCYDYWHPFFNSIKERKVSFLSPAASRRLLSQPCDDFPLDYTPETLDRIYDLSHGQPYLVQLIGQNLVYHYNRKVLDGDREPSQPLGIADLEAVIVSPNFFEDGFPYFNGVWLQAQDSPPGQQAILCALSSSAADRARLTELTGFSIDTISEALERLKAHDVICQDDDSKYHYTVELMRRWVANRFTLHCLKPDHIND